MTFDEACAAARTAGAAALPVTATGYFTRTRASWLENARPVAAGVAVSDHDISGVSVRTLTPREANEAYDIVYLHGGGYTFGGCATHSAFASALALATGRTTHVVDYRLAPEHPSPAALSDALAVINAFETPPILIGDSAGGGLALVAARYATVAAIATFSAWTDLGGTLPSNAMNCDADPVLRANRLAVAARAYAGDHLHDVDVSPLHGEIPDVPMLLHVTGNELLLDDTLHYARKGLAQGRKITTMIWPETLHAWHIFGDRLPDGRAALAATGQFIDRLR
jgi:epsilon-lactone hydrolase